jgi:hypothetical protein
MLAVLLVGPFGTIGCSGSPFSQHDAVDKADSGATPDAADEASQVIVVVPRSDAAPSDASQLDGKESASDGSKADASSDGGVSDAEAAPKCAAGASTCEQDDVLTCTDAGVWAAPVPCPASTPYCIGAGACDACTAGATKCSDGTSLQTCTAAGAWGAPATCTGQACVAGACTGTCTPGTTQCGGGGVQTCSATGQWGSATACTQGVCQRGACVGNCSPGSAQCSGNGTQTCGSGGQWGSVTSCTGQTCMAGACGGVCAPGQSQCSGAVPQTCGASTGQWVSGAVSAGQCGAVCTPGATTCAESGVETCGSVGQWGSAVACTDPTPLCIDGACAPCTGGTTACNNACVDEQTDADNCGACGHGCLGGTCAGGICQPITLVSTSADGSRIVVDADDVYWEPGSQVVSCPIGGGCGTGTVVYSAPQGASIYGLAMPSSSSYDGFLYIGMDMTTDDGLSAYLVQVTKSTLATQVTNLFDDITAPDDLVFDSVNSWLYMADDGDGSGNPSTGGSLDRFKPDGSQFAILLGGLDGPSVRSLAIDSSYVYVSTYGTGDVYFCPLTGTCLGSHVALGGLGIGAEGVYSDGTHLWATSLAGDAVYECGAGQACGTPTPFSSGQTSPHSVVADASYVYWANGTQLMRCPVSGCVGNLTVYVSGISSAGGWQLAQDASAVYWADDLGVRKVAK